MNPAPEGFIFSPVPSYWARQAYEFHESQAGNEHIWPRTKDQIREYAKTGQLFAVRRASTAEFVGLCYGTLDGEHGDEWEIGGLTVPQDLRRHHLGTFLIRLALAHTIASNRPWHAAQQVIAHVHDENPRPRNILKLMGFEFFKKVEVPGDIAPPSMKRNAAGNVPGDQFRFPPTAVKALLEWFEHEFKGTLDDGKTPASFETTGGLGALIEALREAEV